jgi:uncharacterized damage-inducible protein DinB
VISDVSSFVRYLEGVHRRTARDVGSLPPEAQTWKPPPSSDEESSSWTIPDIVRHIAEARLFFAGAFMGEGWVWDRWPDGLERIEAWLPALEKSSGAFSARVSEAPDERLASKVDPMAGEGRPLSGWRVLMMMVEHEIHHRSQLETYAGLNGWPVNQLFGRTNEWVVSQRESEMRDRPERP